MSSEDRQIEELLLKYRVSGPPMELKGRVLSSGQRVTLRWKIVGWAAAAAVLVVSTGLHWATVRMERQMGGMLEPGQIWSAEAEELAQMMDGEGAGRRYLALRLAVGHGTAQPETISLKSNPHTGEI